MISSDKNNSLLRIALGVAVVAIIALTFLLFQQYQHVQRLGYVSIHRQSLLRSLHGSGPLTAADASSTAVWMTFEYINRVFVLPSAYLEINLDITDSHYPRLTIMEYAKDAGLAEAVALVKVQNAIGAYFGSKQ
jgi:hypothetical protein